MKKQTVLIALTFFLFSFPSFAEEKTVLVIESYHAEHPWDISYKEGITEILGDRYALVFFQMDTKRLPESEHPKQAEMAWREYEKIRPALVILGDDNALKHLAPRFANTQTPVVYLGINRNPRDYGAFDPKNITGVLERPLLKRSLMSLKSLVRPEPRKILVLFDKGTTSQSSVAEAFKGHTTLPVYGITAQLRLIGKWEEWKRTVLNAKKEGFDAMVIGLYHTVTDQKGGHVGDKEVLRWTVENTPLPPFAFWDFTVGRDKAIGGFVLFGKEQGRAAGEIALKILSGKSPDKIMPKIPDMGRFLFSRSGLEKWGIALPDEIASEASFVD